MDAGDVVSAFNATWRLPFRGSSALHCPFPYNEMREFPDLASLIRGTGIAPQNYLVKSLV